MSSLLSVPPLSSLPSAPPGDDDDDDDDDEDDNDDDDDDDDMDLAAMEVGNVAARPATRDEECNGGPLLTSEDSDIFPPFALPPPAVDE